MAVSSVPSNETREVFPPRDQRTSPTRLLPLRPCSLTRRNDAWIDGRDGQPIGEENRGYRLLKKMGWKVGQGLGLKGDGITVPVVLRSQVATLGLGKTAEDERCGMIPEASEGRVSSASRRCFADPSAAFCALGLGHARQ